VNLSIGALARAGRTNPPTIRYYEQIGLLRPAERRGGGHRTYDEADLRRVTFIRRCRQLGFPIPGVRDLVDLLESADRTCVQARDLARGNLEAVRMKMAELQELEASLAKLVEDCDRQCAGAQGPGCVILDDLAQPRSSCCG